MPKKIRLKKKNKRLMLFLIQFNKTPSLKKIRKLKHCMADMRTYQVSFLIKRLGKRDKVIVQKEVIGQ